MAGSVDKIADEVRRLAEEVVSPLGLEVVEVIFRRQGKHSLLRIDIDRPGVPGVSLGDCEWVSTAVDRVLDGTELFGDSYELQVSSPGVDRPIVSDADFRRNTGRPLLVETTEKLLGISTFRGALLGLERENLRLDAGPGGEVTIPRNLVLSARQDVDQDLHAAGKGARPRGKRDRRGIVGTPSS